MTEQTRASARCEDCDKVYHVPDPDRTYHCKACGGTVRSNGRAEPEAAHAVAIDGMLTCTECQAVNPRGARFCVECDALLSGKAEDVMTDEETARLRHDAAAELRGAHKSISLVTALFWTGAVLYTFATVAAVLALAQLEVPLVPGIVVVALTTSLSVLLLMGATHILFKPFLWTVLIAVLATVVTLVHLIGPNPYGVAFLGSAVWALTAWAALIPTRRFAQTMERHQDLYILHHASKQTRRSLRGQFAKERHARLVAAMRRASRRAWKVSTAVAAGIVLASVLGTYMVTTSMRPQELTPLVVEFEAAWNAGGLEAVSESFHPNVRAKETTWLRGVTAGHGWAEQLPSVQPGERRGGESQDRVWFDYELGQVPMSAGWSREGQSWFLVEIELPAPPLAPKLERFAQAWDGSDAEAIAALFAPDSREKMLGYIRQGVRNRRWRSFPPIRETVLDDHTNGRSATVFKLEDGEVTTEWHLRPDGTWVMHGLRFPKR